MKRVLGILTIILAMTAPLAVSAQAAYTVFTLRLNVSNCNGCRVTLSQAMSLDGEMSTFSRRAVVRNGKASFSFPKSRGVKLVLNVYDRHAVSDNAATAAVLRYAGKEPGQRIAARTALKKKHGFVCSARLTKSVTTWNLKVAHYPARDFITNKKGYGTTAYLSPGIATTGPVETLYHGRFGYQDGPFC